LHEQPEVLVPSQTRDVSVPSDAKGHRFIVGGKTVQQVYKMETLLKTEVRYNRIRDPPFCR